jgi:hypothetical protein
MPLFARQISKLFGNQGFRVTKKTIFAKKRFLEPNAFFKTVLKMRKKTQFYQNLIWAFLLLPHYFSHHKILQDNMEDIKNSRGKGYCMLYIFMGLFFLTAILLMLYNRSSVLDFGR